MDNNNHSVFTMYYHLIMVIKYRRKVFDDDISLRAKEIFEYIASGYNITLIEWNQDNGFGKFVPMLEYKLNEQGKELIKVGKWFPSSKKCSNCGVLKKTLTLSERTYYYKNCGLTIDRDLNASYNIRNEGWHLFLTKHMNKTLGHTGSGRKQVCCSTKQPG